MGSPPERSPRPHAGKRRRILGEMGRGAGRSGTGRTAVMKDTALVAQPRSTGYRTGSGSREMREPRKKKARSMT